MQRLENYTLQLFINNLVKTLKEENDNEYRESYDDDCSKLDIPFIISSLYQSFKNNHDKYKKFSEDLKCYHYDIILEESRNDYNGLLDANIFLYDDDGWNLDWYYQIKFDFEGRYLGYCECTPDMSDYREDKCCCGHGCDADFSSFTLNKVIKISNGTWQGDEHSYWEFEDDFYKDEKEKERKETEIQELRKRLEEIAKKLKELEGDN